MHIQTLFPKPSVEGFGHRVARRLAPPAEVEDDLVWSTRRRASVPCSSTPTRAPSGSGSSENFSCLRLPPPVLPSGPQWGTCSFDGSARLTEPSRSRSGRRSKLRPPTTPECRNSRPPHCCGLPVGAQTSELADRRVGSISEESVRDARARRRGAGDGDRRARRHAGRGTGHARRSGGRQNVFGT